MVAVAPSRADAGKIKPDAGRSQKTDMKEAASAAISPAADQAVPPQDLKKYETDATFKGGLKIHFRPIQPDDEALLKELFYSHSEQTIMHRYLAHIRCLSQAQVRKFVALDYHNDFALVGLAPHEGRERMICVGRYFRDPSGGAAEIAVTVHDDFQHHDIGTFLVRALADIAREHGITAFTASVLADNQAMMRVFHKVADKMEAKLDSGVYQVRLDLAGKDAGARTKNC
jgi:RimJ/RimL family protein N-acetyltransferase